jgi:hypothetical protein
MFIREKLIQNGAILCLIFSLKIEHALRIDINMSQEIQSGIAFLSLQRIDLVGVIRDGIMFCLDEINKNHNRDQLKMLSVVINSIIRMEKRYDSRCYSLVDSIINNIVSEKSRIKILRSLFVSVPEIRNEMYINLPRFVLSDKNQPNGKKFIRLFHKYPGIGHFLIKYRSKFTSKMVSLLMDMGYFLKHNQIKFGGKFTMQYLIENHNNILLKSVRKGKMSGVEILEGLFTNSSESIEINVSRVRFFKRLISHCAVSEQFDRNKAIYVIKRPAHDIRNTYVTIKNIERIVGFWSGYIRSIIHGIDGNKLLRIMVLHRKYRKLDQYIPDWNKVLYGVLKNVALCLFGKNLSKMALYYV